MQISSSIPLVVITLSLTSCPLFSCTIAFHHGNSISTTSIRNQSTSNHGIGVNSRRFLSTAFPRKLDASATPCPQASSSSTHLFAAYDEIPSFVTTMAEITTGTASTTQEFSLLSVLATAAAGVINIDDQRVAEQLAGPLFGASLFPYIAFLYFLNVKENETPKGVTVGFATCLLFVFLTIPAAIASQQMYGVTLADCDWLHGSAESLLTITNLVTILAFRQALQWKGQQQVDDDEGTAIPPGCPPKSATSYQPMITLVGVLTIGAAITAVVPALPLLFDTGMTTAVHTPYLGGFMDLSPEWVATFSHHTEPENALTVACWIIHWSSLVEFLVAMGFVWRWADVVGNQRWKGITWGLLPLHSSGITACTYHIFYNSVPLMVPLQAFLTLFGNITAAYAAYRLAISNGWNPQSFLSASIGGENMFLQQGRDDSAILALEEEDEGTRKLVSTPIDMIPSLTAPPSLIGFEDLGDALSKDTDYTFLVKLFVGCAIASYVVKYAELQVDFPFWTSSEQRLLLALLFVFIPSALNAFKWYQRSRDPSFEGWF
jgi:hypothetical protein